MEIRQRVESQTGFHARAYKSSAGQADCARCHMEHNGEKFTLVRLDRKTFDHAAQTGFALEGKHASLDCQKCHTSKNIAVSARAQIKVKDLNQSFLGLRRECTNCHEDAHRGQEGTDCLRCHQPNSWRATPGFNHSSTAFPLTGRHQEVACEKCHTSFVEKTAASMKGGSGEAPALFKGLNYGGCQSCHNDPHRGAFHDVRFAGSCQTCHNTGGWRTNSPGGSFDHSTTKFKLVGKHAELSCSRCHQEGDFHRRVPHDRCADCHQDPHKGQFVSRANGSDCSACHNQVSYKPAVFDRAAHARAAFPLEGKHADVACVDCHQPAGRDAVYITRKVICSACHTDQHAGQFAGAPWNNKCDACHAQTGFQIPTFTVARHTDTKFGLTGKHATVACGDCHKPLEPPVVSLRFTATISTATVKSPGSAGPLRNYHFTSENCNACHMDPHQTKLACETCHTTEAWKAVLPFDHATTQFSLDGAHEKAKCVDCHQGKAPQFASQAKECSSCHAMKDIHAGQFRNGREEDCTNCHAPTEWKRTIFNHDGAKFPLDVAHRKVACEKCHKEQKTAAGTTVRVYRGTPTECVNCH